MKKRKYATYLLIILGIILTAYPFISNIFSKYNQTKVISKYQEDVKNATKEQKEEELKKAKEYNESLIEGKKHRKYNNYLNVLNIGEVIAYIDIPKIKVHLPIYHGTSDNVLQSGVGHMEGTSLPIGGMGTHCALSAHTGLVRTKMFDDINKLKIGDKFYIHVLDNVLAYKVDNIKVVLPKEMESLIEIDESHDYVTLITCTPYMINTHRLLVRGARTNLDEDEKQKMLQSRDIEKQKLNLELLIKIVFIATFLILLFLIILFLIKKKKKYKGKHEK